MNYVIWSQTPDETHNVGKRLGSLLKRGDVLALYGELGAGKTALAQGIASALGVAEQVISPTYTLIHEYSAWSEGELLKLIHMDLYRLQYPEEAEIIGVGDVLQGDTIGLIEWPEIGEDLLPVDRLTIKIEGAGDVPRKIIFSAVASEWEERLKELEQ